MGKHGANEKLWPSILGLISVALVAAAVILIIIWNPQWMPRG